MLNIIYFVLFWVMAAILMCSVIISIIYIEEKCYKKNKAIKRLATENKRLRKELTFYKNEKEVKKI